MLSRKKKNLTVLRIVNDLYKDDPVLTSRLSTIVSSVAAGNIAAIICSILLIIVRLPIAAVICLGLIYASASLVNSSLLSIFPSRFEARGSMASVSGIMDFGNYIGAATGSFIYGYAIDCFGYNFMFISWIAVSVLSIPALLRLMRCKIS